jgi:hypothetical protein
MSDVLDNIYLPNFEKRKIRESEPYQLLKENNIDPSSLEGYYDTEAKKHATPIEFTELNSINDKEEWLSKHVNKEVYKEYFSNIGDFFVETGKDTALSLATAVVNGADVAVNMMPLMVKALDKFPLPGSAPGTLSTETEDKLMQTATTISNNLDGVRNYLNDFKKDDNFVSQMIGIASQDMLYSIPIYNKLRAIGMPKYPAFFLSGGVGGAIGIEKKVLGLESTFVHQIFEKDLVELKNLVGILPNTPYDKIADEAIQALEYGVFSAALPGVIDALKFMKKNIPAFASTAVGTTALTVGNEVEANPLKAIANAVTKVPVFKSAVVDAATKLPKGSGEQIFNTIKNTPGVKESELKWIGLEDFLKDKKQVTQQEVLDFIEANRLDVNETRFGAPLETSETKKIKPLKELPEQEYRLLQNEIYRLDGEQAEEYVSYVAEHLDFLKNANFKRIDTFPLKKVQYETSSGSEILSDQSDNIHGFMSEYDLYQMVNGWDDGGRIGFDYWQDTFAEFYQIESKLISKKTRQQIDATTEADIYANFYNDIALPEDMAVNNMSFIPGNEFENFKIYLDKSDLMFDQYSSYQIPTSKQKEVYNEMMIRSNEDMYYQLTDKSINQEIQRFRGLEGSIPPKYEGYTSSGGDDYTELVFTLSKGGDNVGSSFPIETQVTKASSVGEAELRPSPHFSVPGEISHVRFKTRNDKGLKVLAVEEMQSDLVQNVKKFNEASIQNKRRELIQAEGTRQIERNRFENMSENDIANALEKNLPDDLIKDFPFKNNWYELVIKRLVRYAADNGFDAISFPKASIIQDRYGLTKRVSSVQVGSFDLKRGEIGIDAVDQNGMLQVSDRFKFKDAEKKFGKENFDKILAATKKFTKEDFNEGKTNISLGKQLEIGGEGKANLYDKAIPSYLKKYAKKWNADVYSADMGKPVLGLQLSTPEKLPVTIMKITPEMKQGVQSSSQPLFELFGTVGLSTWGAKTVSDNIENNIISEKTF